MNNLKIYKSALLFFVLFSIFSCSKEDDSAQNLESSLIGEWQRSDYSDEFEYKLIFNSDYTGQKIERETNLLDGTTISSLVSFNWSTNNNTLKMNFDGEMITTDFSFNSDGHLFLNDFSNFYFKKLK